MTCVEGCACSAAGFRTYRILEFSGVLFEQELHCSGVVVCLLSEYARGIPFPDYISAASELVHDCSKVVTLTRNILQCHTTDLIAALQRRRRRRVKRKKKKGGNWELSKNREIK